MGFRVMKTSLLRKPAVKQGSTDLCCFVCEQGGVPDATCSQSSPAAIARLWLTPSTCSTETRSYQGASDKPSLPTKKLKVLPCASVLPMTVLKSSQSRRDAAVRARSAGSANRTREKSRTRLTPVRMAATSRLSPNGRSYL